ncbi:hypothetical protein PO909_029663 [Leuciscus waleckii]
MEKMITWYHRPHEFFWTVIFLRSLDLLIGHSFIHGGPLLTGLSTSMFNLLLGSDEPAIIDMKDCPDQDIIDIVSLLEEPRNLTDVERYKVIGRREKQMKQIKRGLRDTGVLLMIKERPSLITVLFPRAVDKIILPQMVLERVIWPMTQNENEEDEDEDDQEVPLELKWQMASYLRMYIELH